MVELFKFTENMKETNEIYIDTNKETFQGYGKKLKNKTTLYITQLHFWALQGTRINRL